MVINNGTNNGENKVEKTKKSDENLELKFRKDFIFEALNKRNTKEKNEFIEDLITSDKVSTKILEELNQFKNINIEEYSSIDINKISHLNLQSLVAKQYANLERERNIFMQKVLLDYEIDTNIYNNLIKDKTKGFSISELGEIYNSEIKLENFLNKKNKLNLNKRENIKILSFLGDETSKRLEKLNSEDKNQIIDILQRLDYSGNIKDSDFRFIFTLKTKDNESLLKKEEKKEIISTFIPFISIEKAISFGILSKEEGESRLKQEAKKILNNAQIEDDKIDFLLKYFKKDEVLISTLDIDNIDNIDQIAEEIGFKNFENNLKELSEKEKEMILKSGPKNLKELIEGFISIDNNGNRFNHLEKFKEGNIIEISRKNNDGNLEKSYLKIILIDNNNKNFSYKVLGKKIKDDSEINLENDSLEIPITFIEFLNKFSLNEAKLDFFTTKEIEKKIENGELNKSGLNIITQENLTDEKKSKLLKNYQEYLDDEIINLQNEISSNGSEKENVLLTEILNKKQEQRNNIGNISIKELIDFNNFNELVSKLNELDEEGKNLMSRNGEKGLFKGMFIKTQKEGIFEIDGIDDGIITLKNEAGNKEPIGFNDFFEAFKKHKAKRIKPIFNFSELIDGNKIDKKNWGNHELVDGKLIAKNVEDGDENADREVEYLIGEKTNKIIKISNISGNNVTIQFGERKDNNDLTKEELKTGKYKKNKDGKYEGETLFIKGAKSYTINLNQLNELIKEDDLYPSWQTGKQIKQKSSNNLTNKFNISLSSWLFSHTSVSELIAGGKMFLNSIEETLKKGNELHSAKAALAMGKFLPKELKQELKIKVERAESEAMDKELESLGKVDSRIAVERIESWLLNKNCAEHKKEAGLLFMLEKYGHLTSKGALYKYRGKFLWYEAFGGRINDDFYMTIKKESEADNITFSEEYLMHRLLKKQCGEKGFLGHKRRSRLHKEFEGKWAAGIEAEIEKGYKDASNKRTAKTMVAEGLLSEAAGGTTSNAIGWFKKAIERGGTIENMSEGFFCLLYSGAIFDLDQKTFLKIKNLWSADNMPIIMTRFCTTYSDMELFNDTVLNLSKRIGDIYGGNIYNEALSLYKDVKNKNGSEKERLIKTHEFWKKYGKQLTRALSFIHTSDTSTSKTDNIIFLEKEKNENFKKYYDKTKSFCGEITFGKDFMDDAALDEGVTGLDVKGLTKSYLRLNPTRQLNDAQIGPKVWNKFMEAVTSVNKKQFYPGEIIDEETRNKDIELKRIYLLNFLKELCSGFLEIAADEILRSYNSTSTDIGKFFNTIGLHLYNDLGKISPSDVLNTDKADKILLKSVDKILDGTLDGGFDNYFYTNPLDDLVGNVKGNVDNKLK